MAETLDPSDWQSFRALAHRMIDDMIDHLSSLREQPAWRPVPDETRTALAEPLPLDGEGEERVYDDFLRNVLPYTNGNRHPRFWGWVQGNGTPLAMLADMLAAGINPHMAGFHQAPVLVEQQVLAWMAELMGFPREASGLLLSGGTMANITALIVARHAAAGFDVRREGLQSGDRRLLVYGSEQTHNWVITALDVLGLGSNAFRAVPVESDYRIDVAALRAMIERDRAEGQRPICVIGTAGTVNTGATDDLKALASLCREYRLWFHIDAAFGAWARLVDELKPIVAGLEEADSIAFDLHKWMYLPFEIACVLVRDAKTHRAAFSQSGSYLSETSRGVIAGGLPLANRGIELTRGFKALKAWMTIKAYGINKFARLVAQNVEQARYLVKLITDHPQLELLAPVPLNIVCFRFTSSAMSDAQLNALNEELLVRLQESGVAVPSGTVLQGRFALRVAITNHRSRFEDFKLFIEAVVEQGNAIAELSR